MHPTQLAVAGAVVQPVHGQRGGGPLGHRGQAGRWGRRGADHQPTPVALGPADPGDQPPVAGVPVRASRRPDVARAAFPVVQEGALDGRVRRARHVVDDPVLCALEDDRRPREPLRRSEDLGRSGLGDAQLGERVVDALGRPQLGELVVDEPLADGLGDGREAYLSAQRHQWESPLLALVDQGGRQRRPAPAQLDHQSGRVGIHQAARRTGPAPRRGRPARYRSSAPGRHRAAAGRCRPARWCGPSGPDGRAGRRPRAPLGPRRVPTASAARRRRSAFRHHDRLDAPRPDNLSGLVGTRTHHDGAMSTVVLAGPSTTGQWRDVRRHQRPDRRRHQPRHRARHRTGRPRLRERR